MVNMKNVESKFIATIRFGRVHGDLPHDSDHFEGSYAEVIAWLASQQMSKYPIACFNVSRVIAATSARELRESLRQVTRV